jgi:glycosyltransferase involved in cell wall biosynthesis
VTLEAMALGKPVVATSHGGAAEQLRVMFPQGLVAVGDAEALAVTVAEVIINGEVPETVARSFLLGNMLGSTKDVYDILLADPLP